MGVAAPAGPVDEERLQRGVAELEALGFAVRVGDGVLERQGFTAGALERRLAQLHGLFADPEVAAIVCARGGAGAGRLLARLDARCSRIHPKPLVGYSDITCCTSTSARLGVVSLHGPMVARELADGESAYDRESLWHALTGEGDPSSSAPTICTRCAREPPRASCAAAASRSWRRRRARRGPCDRAGEPTILFLEDVDEPPYRLDRMLLQLRASGALDGVAGIVFGEMKGCAPRAARRTTRSRRSCSRRSRASTCRWPSASPAVTPRAPTSRCRWGCAARLECGASEARFDVLEVPVA